MSVETERFTLIKGATDQEFVRADAALQEWGYLGRPGLRRRTTLRGEDGGWLVITYWDSPQHSHDAPREGVWREWFSLIDPASYDRRFYEGLE